MIYGESHLAKRTLAPKSNIFRTCIKMHAKKEKGSEDTSLNNKLLCDKIFTDKLCGGIMIKWKTKFKIPA